MSPARRFLLILQPLLVGGLFWLADALHDHFVHPELGFLEALWQVQSPLEMRGRLVGTGVLGVVSVLAVLAYISLDRKRWKAQDEARRAARRFDKLWDHLATGVFISTLEGKFLHVNDAVWRLAGFESKNEALSVNARTVYSDPADRERFVKELKEKGVVKNLEILSRRKDGSTYWIALSAAVINDEDGEPPHILGFVEDITSRKITEHVVRESEERFRTVFTMSPVGIIGVSLDYRLIQANPAFCAFTGYTPDELIGRKIQDITYIEDKVVGYPQFDQMRDGQLDHVEIEKRYVHKNGEPVWAFVAVRTVRDSTGQPLHFLTIIIDIRARKKAEQERDEAQGKLMRINAELEKRVHERTAELEVANHELESFAYSVSHDLRAPLRGIDGWSLAVLEDFGAQLDPTAKEYLNRVRSETMRMSELVTDLLGLARVARVEMRREEISLTVLGLDLVGRIGGADPGRCVEWCIAPELVTAGDAGLLEILLRNLLENAFKFTSRKPAARIELGLVPNTHVPTFFVKDNGAGFDPVYADKLFLPFHRLHGLSDFPGTGIGLATVHRIVRRHGGRVWAESTPEKGATFFFTLSAS